MDSPSKEVTLCNMRHVFLYIPSELSATGFELKISGVLKVVKKGEESTLRWDPEELTCQDVAALYSAEADGWTMVDEVHVESTECGQRQSDSLYPVLDLDPPDPIVHTQNPDGSLVKQTVQSGQMACQKSPVCFLLSDLKCLRELTLRNGVRTLTAFLKDGKELPTLYFHDGGTSGLLQTLQRFLYLVRDGKDRDLVRVEENPLILKTRVASKSSAASSTNSDALKPSGLLHSAVLEVGKRVRHSFRTSQNLLEERPVEEDEVSPITCRQLEETSADHLDPDASLISDFQLITDLRGYVPPRPPLQPRLAPLSREEWESYRDLNGIISPENEKKFRARVFAGSIDPDLRREIWKYLLGYFPFSATDIERMEIQKEKEHSYDAIRDQWQSFFPEQEKNWYKWRELKQLVEKDVARTDREMEMYQSINSPRLKQLQNILCTYIMYNFDLGYVQGMSDLLSPLLVVMDNEADTFWCFVGLMNIVQDHFEMSQECMRMRIKKLRLLLSVCEPKLYSFLKQRDSSNLYFTFRWLLVDFKREFQFPDLMMLWEVLWTRHLSTDYALFVALAIIDIQKEHLQKPEFDFSDIIAHINGLSKNLAVNSILQTAESICKQLARMQQLPEDLLSLLNEPFTSD